MFIGERSRQPVPICNNKEVYILNNYISSSLKISILAINYNLSTFQKPLFQAITYRSYNDLELGFLVELLEIRVQLNNSQKEEAVAAKVRSLSTMIYLAPEYSRFSPALLLAHLMEHFFLLTGVLSNRIFFNISLHISLMVAKFKHFPSVLSNLLQILDEYSKPLMLRSSLPLPCFSHKQDDRELTSSLLQGKKFFSGKP